jgi:hypothetical protein
MIRIYRRFDSHLSVITSYWSRGGSR